jgi:hypothetical protein
VSQANAVAAPGASAGARRRGFKAELDGVRDRIRALGFGYDEIAVGVCRHQVRPRKAYRLAWGGRWTRWRRGSMSVPRAGGPIPTAGRA